VALLGTSPTQLGVNRKGVSECHRIATLEEIRNLACIFINV